jgi:protein TonB
MRTLYEQSNLQGNLLTNGSLGFAFTGLIFFPLPMMHILGQLNFSSPGVVVSEVGETAPAPPPEEFPAPPEPKQEVEKPEVDEPPPLLTLNQLEIALNPGSGDTTNDFSFGDFDQESDVIADMKIFNISDRDEVPECCDPPLGLGRNSH